MRKRFCKRKPSRFLSMLLVIAVLCGLLEPATASVLSAEQPVPCVLMHEEPITETVLTEGAKLRFEAGYEGEVSSYQWQIQNPEDNEWISIADGYSKYLWVTYALIGSMLTKDGAANIRCSVGTSGGEICTEPVRVNISLNVNGAPTQQAENSDSTKPKILRSVRSNDQELTTYSIVINYLFDDNTIAFEPYGATVAAGSSFTTNVKSPEIVGYQPFRQDGANYVKADTVDFNMDKVDKNITINVIYEPTLVDYTVHHHLQNILDDDYFTEHLTTSQKGLTGTLVGAGLALTEEELPGFKALDYDETLVIAADGSTVVEIRYDRNYYLVSFDMNGGYGTEPIYTRFGATVGANTPTRHGYIFDGWELVSYNGQTPTNEQKSQYALGTGNTIQVPAANLKYKARWITQETTYTMVFWRENANDNGYTYWGYLDNLPAMSGSYVSAQHYISQVDGIDDEQHFTFNASRSDKNVMVEGDGSTVVNAYYTRNYYSITLKASGTCILPTSHTHTDACYDTICGSEHIHTTDCVPNLICTTEEHLTHTDECIECRMSEHIHGSVGCDCTQREHNHTVTCWKNVGSEQSSVANAPDDPKNGQIHAVSNWFWNTNYYIYINGVWYSYTGPNVSEGSTVSPACGKKEHTHGTDCSCTQVEHTHEDSCYKDSLHTHEDHCYKYSCGMVEHIHSDDCKRLICGIPTSHSHSGEGTSGKVVKIVYAKYRESLKEIWPIKDDNKVVYDDGQRWDPSDTTLYNQVLVYIDEMPGDDFTLTVDSGANRDLFTMNYYLQVLPGDDYDITYKGKQYARYTQIKAKYNMVTKAEDFFPIRGFNQYIADPDFRNGTSVDPSDLIVDFYYDRITDHKISFNNNGTVLDDKTVYGEMYGAPVKKYNFEPPYPTNLEPNAYTFDGWYTSPGCFAGTEMDWDNTTMPEGDLLLYAKWRPITHTVRVYKDKNMTEQIGAEQIVDHGSFAHAPTGNITNGNYVFLGWFYEDVVNGQKVEKAFVFDGIPVLDDMDIYARWGSHFSVNYKIYYKLESGEEIAPPTEGSAIVGNNKTFYAKTEGDLNAGYQTGYYPKTSSHTITMSAEGNHEFTFYYEYVPSMPYKVQYLDEDGNKVFDDKRVMDNNLSVVTENFKKADKMMPDAYQKRLVLSADTKDADGDGIYDANVITFYYNADEVHAYYRVVHYIENITGGTYREFSAQDNVGVIGDTCSGNALTITGFRYMPEKTMVNGSAITDAGTTVSTILSADGALIEFYYDRLDYDYQVRYVNKLTNEKISEEKMATAAFGEQIVEYAPNFQNIGYELVSDSTALLTISSELDKNIITFYYQEKYISVKYQVVGPDSCGDLTQNTENLQAISGEPTGSTPLVQNGFLFQGWYKDPDCTEPVEATWVDGSNHLTPQKIGSVWTDTTYYAKFAALETELTITTKSTVDADQVFIFHIKGTDTNTEEIDLTVTVIGDSSVTITKLPVGNYTVTEMTDWSWRYENENAVQEVMLNYNGGATNEIIFNNSRENGKWLDGNATKDNQF